MDNEILYRKPKKTTPKMDYSKEDADWYGYTDTNVGPIVDNDFTPSYAGEINPTGVFRKHKRNRAKLLRKPIKKCKCK